MNRFKLYFSLTSLIVSLSFFIFLAIATLVAGMGLLANIGLDYWRLETASLPSISIPEKELQSLLIRMLFCALACCTCFYSLMKKERTIAQKVVWRANSVMLVVFVVIGSLFFAHMGY